MRPENKKPLIISIVLFATTLILFLWSFKTYFFGGQSFEFCHYAEIARNILSGHGYNTRMFMPSDLAYIHEAGRPLADYGPVVARFPLFAYWSAFWMKIFGINDFGMAMGNGIAHGLFVVFVFLLGRKLFNNSVGIISAVLWMIHPHMLAGWDLLGTPDVLNAVLFGIFIYLSWTHLTSGEELGLRTFFLLGLLAGATYLVRQSFVIWLPVFLFGLFQLKKPKAPIYVGLFAAGFILICLPWQISYLIKLHRFSTPQLGWQLASDVLTNVLPWSEYRVYPFSEYLSLEIIWLLLKKFNVLFNLFMKSLPTLWECQVIFPFFLLGLLKTQGKPSKFGWWVSALFVWQALVFSFLRYEPLSVVSGRYYFWFAPFVAIYAVSFFASEKLQRTAKIVAAIAVLLLIQSWAPYFKEIPNHISNPDLPKISDLPELAYIREHVSPESRIASNIPSQVCWYTERAAINITNSPQDFPAMTRDYPVDYILLVNRSIGEIESYPEWSYMVVHEREIPESSTFKGMGYELEQDFANALLFRRKKA